MTDDLRRKEKPRLSSGIPGLDYLLQDGFIESAIYMVMGRPGAGKTILGNQVCFNHVANGGRALYVTLLTESHARLLSSMESMKFYDPIHVGDGLTYLSAYQPLEAEGLEGLLKVIRLSLKEHKATLLVLDGLITAGSIVRDENALKKFIHELQVLVELVGCTTLLLTGARDLDSNYAERTMVDGLIQLSMRRVGMYAIRDIEVLKHRGSNIVMGAHFFDISDKGITVHPRLESVCQKAESAGHPRPRVSTGVAGLDGMLEGGLAAGSSTLLAGASGTGKTLLGLNFLHAGVRLKEPGLHFGFVESSGLLVEKADRISLGVGKDIESGIIEFVLRSPIEQVADAMAEELLAAVKRNGVRRLFIDRLASFQEALIFPERLGAFLSALFGELRALGVTTVVSADSAELFGTATDHWQNRVSALTENVILLRTVERDSRLRRVVSVLKVQHGGFDPLVREYLITDKGVFVDGPLSSDSPPLRKGARAKSAGRQRSRG